MELEKEKRPAANGAQRYSPNQFTNNAGSAQDIAEMFAKALSQEGLATKDKIIPDGKLHRFRVEGDKPGSKNGFYVLCGNGVPAGAFGCWKRGISQTWCAKPDRELTRAQRVQNRRRMLAAQKAREAEDAERHKAARDKAILIWKSSCSAPDNHPYLVKKGIGNHGLRLRNSTLVVPLQDSDENLHGLQFIDGQGSKRFLSGSRKKGCYFLIGSPAKSLGIAEGYATAASIHESTGLPMAIAFDAGNLLSVAQALRAKFPRVEIILCADNDENTLGNPGLTKAREAAIAVGALLAVPPVAGDFNDLLTGRSAQ